MAGNACELDCLYGDTGGEQFSEDLCQQTLHDNAACGCEGTPEDPMCDAFGTVVAPNGCVAECAGYTTAVSCSSSIIAFTAPREEGGDQEGGREEGGDEGGDEEGGQDEVGNDQKQEEGGNGDGGKEEEGGNEEGGKEEGGDGNSEDPPVDAPPAPGPGEPEDSHAHRQNLTVRRRTAVFPGRGSERREKSARKKRMGREAPQTCP